MKKLLLLISLVCSLTLFGQQEQAEYNYVKAKIDLIIRDTSAFDLFQRKTAVAINDSTWALINTDEIQDLTGTNKIVLSSSSLIMQYDGTSRLLITDDYTKLGDGFNYILSTNIGFAAGSLGNTLRFVNYDSVIVYKVLKSQINTFPVSDNEYITKWASDSLYKTRLDSIVDVLSGISVIADSSWYSIQLLGGTGDQGTMTWNDTEETVDLIQNGSTLQVGQEFQVPVINKTGSLILNGTVVMYGGGTADGRIKIRPYNSQYPPAYIVGVTTYDINNNGYGKATTQGKINEFNTELISGTLTDSIIYVDTDGSLTYDMPESINVPIGVLIRKETSPAANNGVIYVRTIPLDYYKVDHGEYAFQNLLNDSIWSNIASAARLYGGLIHDNGDGSVSVGAGAGIYKEQNGGLEAVPQYLLNGQGSKIIYATWDSVASLALTDNAYNYIYFDGTDSTIKATTNFYSISYTQAFTLGRAYREGTSITVRLCGTNAWNYNRRVQLFGEEVFPIKKGTGLIISNGGGRIINITAGILWAELVNRFSVSAYNGATTDFTYHYQNGSGGWNTTTTNKIDSFYYDNGTGTLAALGNNQYGAHWVYVVHDGSVHVVYGRASYTSVTLQSISPPANIPGLLSSYASLVGVVTIQKSATTLNSVKSAYTEIFNTSNVTNHNDLGGIQGGTYHLTNSEYTNMLQDSARVYDSITALRGDIDTKISSTATTNQILVAGADGNAVGSSDLTYNGNALTTGKIAVDTLTSNNSNAYGLKIFNATGLQIKSNTNTIRFNVNENIWNFNGVDWYTSLGGGDSLATKSYARSLLGITLSDVENNTFNSLSADTGKIDEITPPSGTLNVNGNFTVYGSPVSGSIMTAEQINDSLKNRYYFSGNDTINIFANTVYNSPLLITESTQLVMNMDSITLLNRHAEGDFKVYNTDGTSDISGIVASDGSKIEFTTENSMVTDAYIVNRFIYNVWYDGYNYKTRIFWDDTSNIADYTDVTPPVAQSHIIYDGNADSLIITFNESVTGTTGATTGGWTLTGFGTHTVTNVAISGNTVGLLLSDTVSYGNVYTISYNSSVGDLSDLRSNYLVSYNDSNVINNVGAELTQLTAPTLDSIRALDDSSIKVAFTDNNSSPNESYNVIWYDTVNTFNSAVMDSSVLASDVELDTITGLSQLTNYYVKVYARGDGLTTSNSSFSSVLNDTTSETQMTLSQVTWDTYNNMTISSDGDTAIATSGTSSWAVSNITSGTGDFIVYFTMNESGFSTQQAVLGIDNASGMASYTTYDYGLYKYASYFIYKIINGSPTTTSQSGGSNYLLGLRRVGAVIDIVYSSDGGSNWTSVTTLTSSDTGVDYYIKLNHLISGKYAIATKILK